MKLLVVLSIALFLTLDVEGGKGLKCKKQIKRISKCCTMPEITDEAFKSCEEMENSSDESDEKKMWKKDPCVFQCYYKKKSAMNEDGSVIKEKAVELAVTNAQGDAEWAGIMKTSAETCYEKLLAMADKKNEEKNSKNKKCSRQPMFMSICTMVENAKNCPKEKWISNEKCEKAKTKLDSDKCQMKPKNKEVPGAGNEDLPTDVNAN